MATPMGRHDVMIHTHVMLLACSSVRSPSFASKLSYKRKSSRN